MPFSIEVCLEYTGTTELSDTLYFYSNTDNYFLSFGSGLTSELLNGDCPYIIENIPDNTTIIKISDVETLCCFYKPTNITVTPTPTNSATPTQTPTNTPTNTPTLSPTPTSTSIGPCFGYLYNLFAITGTNLNSITSTDNWSVASWNDFNTLSLFVGGNSNLLKLVDTVTYWNSFNTNATNSTGFNAKGAGSRISNLGTYFLFKSSSRYWTITPVIGLPAYNYHVFIDSNNSNININWGSINQNGFLIRLVKTTTILSPGQTGTYIGNDGKTYNTICIGNQEWLSEDLKETKYRNGNVVPNIISPSTWTGLTTGAYSIPNGDNYNISGCEIAPTPSPTPTPTITPTNTTTPSVTPTLSPTLSTTPTNTPTNTQTQVPGVCFGYLYNFYSVTGTGLNSITSSDDWVVPSNTDVGTLRTSVGNSAASIRINDTTTYWFPGPYAPTNTFGFNSKGSGTRNSLTGLYTTIRLSSYYWTSDLITSSTARCWRTDTVSIFIDSYFAFAFRQGQPVRIVKNTTILSPGQTGTYVGNDGTVYSTICIGTQEWLSEDLRETKYRGGTTIPNEANSTVWTGLTTGAYSIYNNNSFYVSSCTTPPNVPTPSPTPTQTITPTNTQTPTNTPSITPTNSVTPTVTQTPPPPQGFISRWTADMGLSNTIVLPYSPTGIYSGTINWGDGNVSANTYANISHTYASSGDYTVTITGQIEGWNFSNFAGAYASSIKEILQWGPLRGENNSNAGLFDSCTNIVLTGVTDTPDLVGITYLNNMFYGCSSITTVNNINNWNVSSVTEMNDMFNNATLFNQNIGSWNVSGVTNMSYMFSVATAFNNGGNSSISGWNVSNVTDMNGMFFNASLFNQNLSGWCVTLITSPPGFFDTGASAWTGAPGTRPQWGTCP